MKIAAQMYSVRGYTGKNGYAASLKELAKIGFRYVEHACGFEEFDGKPAELRKFMDDLGISMVSTHIGTSEFSDPEKRKKTVDFYSILGVKYLITPGDSRFTDYDSQPELIDRMNEAAEFLKSFGMFCGYHNHMYEFLINPKTGKSYWESFADATYGRVVLQQDCGWSTAASRDAADLIRKYPGRSLILHFKPFVRCSQYDKKQSIIGEDSVPWEEIIRAAETVGETDMAIIEQEWYMPGKSDMESIALSYQGLSKLL